LLTNNCYAVAEVDSNDVRDEVEDDDILIDPG
jgi:hypothetical protein